MVLSGPTGAALRCMGRAAVASSKKLTTRGPQQPSSSAINKSMAAVRSMSSGAGLFSRDERPFDVFVFPAPSTTTSVASLSSGLSRLALLKNINNNGNNRQRPFSSSAAAAAHNASSAQQQPLGEPITYITLNTLADNPGAVKKARRIGRGIGSSKGKTSGRGHKGQKARAGSGVHPTFEGGQTKFYKRLPKTGKMKNSRFKLEHVPVNVGKVQDYVTMGRLVPERSDGVITMRDLVNAGMFPNSSVIKGGVKLLGDGKEYVKDKLHIEVPWASRTAIEAIEARGGFVTTVHYNKLALRALLKPHKFPMKPERMIEAEREARGTGGSVGEDDAADADVHDMHLLPRRARPPVKYMPYYTDYEKRGYLNPRVQLERKKRGLKDILLQY